MQKWWSEIREYSQNKRMASAMRLLLVFLVCGLLLVLVLFIDPYPSHVGLLPAEPEIRMVFPDLVVSKISDDITEASLTLPNILNPDTVLAVETKYQTLTVRLGEQVLFSRDPVNPWYLGRELGSVWNVVKIPDSAEGQTIVLVFGTYASNSPSLRSSMMGEHLAVANALVQAELPKLILATLLGGMGVIFFLLAMALHRRDYPSLSAPLFYLSISVFFSVIIVMSESYLLQFTNINLAGAYIIFEIFYLMLPIPFLQYMRSLKPRRGLLLDALSMAQAMLLLTLFYLHFQGYALLVETRHMYRSMLVVQSLTVSGLSLNSLVRKKDQFNRIPLAALCMASLAALATVAVDTARGVSSPVLLIAIVSLIFQIMIAYDLYIKAMNESKVAAESQAYRKIAYTDALTCLNNRTALERDLGNMMLNIVDYDQVGVLVLDLNNLKETNDRFGHLAGDGLIAAAASLIDSSFSVHGRCYRYGGDEFIVVFTDEAAGRIAEYVEMFRRQLDERNRSGAMAISIAWGYSFAKVNPMTKNENILTQVMKQADTAMYARKLSQAN